MRMAKAMICSRSSGRSRVRSSCLTGSAKAMEKGVHQGPSPPAAVSGQHLEIDSEIQHGVLALAETQQLSTGLQAGGRAVEHSLHLRHELPRRPQARSVGVPCRRPPASRSPGQLGDDVRNDVCTWVTFTLTY